MVSYLNGWLAAAFLMAGLTPALGDPSVLTNASEVRGLSKDDAARQWPVHLRGIFLGPTGSPDQGFVIADATEGIYLEGAVSNVNRGDIVEVDGVTDPGGFAPFVRARKVWTVGRGQIPPPLRVNLSELNNGGLDAQWVEVSGVVRSCEPMQASERPSPPPGAIISTNSITSWSERKFKINLAVGDDRLAVQVNDELNSKDYIDAEVRLRGICFSQHNTSRQFINPLLLVPHGVPLEVTKPPPRDPFSLPVQSLDGLLAFDRQSNYGHRVHIRGIITHQILGQFLWLRYGDRGLRAQSAENIALRPGDEVDVAAFPARGQYNPVVEDAVFKKIASGPPPIPTALPNLAAAFRHDADLVEIEAVLLERRQSGDGFILELDWEGWPAEALLRTPAPGSTSQWLPGSRVRVAGICSVQTSKNGPVSGIWHPQSFQLLLRAPQDLRVLRAPSWWTYPHVLLVLGVIAAASLGGVAAVMWLARQRLRDQENRRARAEAEFAAILSERNRMAREIHDTLAQGLAATSVQLRLAKKKINTGAASLGQHLDMAQQLVLESLAEARNSIWNMRSHVLEKNDLVDALSGILNQLSDGPAVQAVIEVTGKRRRLAPMIENNLLRVGQEAITNATRHAHAQRITVALDFADKQFRLRVTDDGAGFDAAQPPPGGGGFGLVGIRERAAQLKGALNIRSTPGRGTDIRLEVPLAE